ncbi:uncharacterized protein LOC115952023 [Quercus lobata]|uniref:uncharacterized protein LOC115952023 n=1 Tax=Quercus lobata TaxID=97700 RepID=UPI00124536BD|nr:uncharacterized protein LOC115952023 [Quercus lobata]
MAEHIGSEIGLPCLDVLPSAPQHHPSTSSLLAPVLHQPQDVGKQGGGETFVMKGFKLWNKKKKLNSHVGGVNGAHNQAVKKSEDLMKEKQHIQSVLVKQSNQDKIEYQGLAFRGHDESQGSSDKGNSLQLLQFLEDHNESINELLQKAPKNCNNLVTVVGGSCKRRNALRDAQFAKIKEDLENGVRRSGQGLNQETNFKRPGNTRWGSYYGTILNLILIFSAIVDVLEIIEEDVIDMQLQELNNRFSEANTDLLLCMACLNPRDSFVAFDKENLIRLAKFYPSDFLGTDILALDSQLQNYIFDMCNNDLFLELQGVSELAEKLVNTGKHET